MKRTNLVLNEHLLDEARKISGLKTWSDVVNLALGELVRRRTVARIDQFHNSDIWESNLDVTRRDRHVSG